MSRLLNTPPWNDDTSIRLHDPKSICRVRISTAASSTNNADTRRTFNGCSSAAPADAVSGVYAAAAHGPAQLVPSAAGHYDATAGSGCISRVGATTAPIFRPVAMSITG